MIIVLLGGSGSGKSFIARNILPECGDVFQVIPKYTTRKSRGEEIGPNGERIVTDVIPDTPEGIVKSKTYYYSGRKGTGEENYYGFDRADIEMALSQGRIPVINNVDEGTYMELMKHFPNQILTLFICLDTYKEGLRSKIMEERGSSCEEIKTRLATEKIEDKLWLERYSENYRVIVNLLGNRENEEFLIGLRNFLKIQIIKFVKEGLGRNSSDSRYRILCNYEDKVHQDTSGNSKASQFFESMCHYYFHLFPRIRYNSERWEGIELDSWTKPLQRLLRHNNETKLWNPYVWNANALFFGFPTVSELEDERYR